MPLELDEQEFLRHEHMALFFTWQGNLSGLPLQSIAPAIPLEIFSPLKEIYPLIRKKSISALEVLIYRILQDETFKSLVQSIWFYLPDSDDALKAGTLAQNKEEIDYFIRSLKSKGEIYNNLENIDIISKQSDAAAARELFLEYEVDDLFILNSLSPFLDLDIARQMYQSHCDYLCEYTFSENVPIGFAGELAHRQILYRFGKEDLPSQFSLGEIVRKNLNDFDLEVHYQSPDIRIFRANGSLEDKMQSSMTSAVIHDLQKIPDYSSFASIVSEKNHLLRVHPTYIDMEIIGQCQLNCIFCPRHYTNIDRPAISTSRFDHILAEISKEGYELTVNLGGMGEPLLHPDFMAFMEKLNGADRIVRIIVESNGLLLEEDLVAKLSLFSTPVHIIINLNAMSEKSYQDLHQPKEGINPYHDLLQKLDKLAAYNDKRKDFLSIQFLKIKQTEDIIDEFYKFWTGKGFNVILQKQNTFNNLVPDFRFSDLTPLERIPCWHLQRDLIVNAEGGVPICKQDINMSKVLGKFADDSGDELTKVWAAGKELAEQHTKGLYPDYPDCANCDEWYTFNF